MIKRQISLCVIVVLLFVLTSCGYGSNYKMSHCKHDFTITTTNASCTAEGKTIKECSICGYTEEIVLPIINHRLTNETIVRAATCTEDGVASYTCAMCGETFERVIPALGHVKTPGKEIIVNRPTCQHEGTATELCQTCGKFFEETVPIIGHDYKNHICTMCGEPDKPLFFTDMKDSSMSSSDYRKFSANIHNYTGKKITFVKVTLELYDKNGKIVDTDWTYAVGSEGLKDRSSAFFEIIYHGLNYSEYSKWSFTVTSYD